MRWSVFFGLILLTSFMLSACEDSLYMEDTESVDEDILLNFTHREHGWSYSMHTAWDDKDYEGQFNMIDAAPIKTQTECPANIQDVIKVPIGKKVRVLASSAYDITSVCIPQIGIKLEAIPGRISEAYFTPIKAVTVCGTCLDENGKLLRNTTIALEIFEP